jgi:hypothetical protein
VREVIVYSRDGCHLCEVMLEQVKPLCRGMAVVVVRDVYTRDDWLTAFGLDVPVMFLDDREVCRHHFDERAFLDALNNPVAGHRNGG